MQVDIELEIEDGLIDGLESGWVGVLQTVAIKTLQHQGQSDQAALTIMLTDDDALHQLNLTYRNEDKPTDVLSFESGAQWPDGTLYLGDIAISAPYASRQAEQHNKTVLEELRLLTVHGVLHLLGYDHATPAEEADMWRLQDEILA